MLYKFPTLKLCHGNQTKWPPFTDISQAMTQSLPPASVAQLAVHLTGDSEGCRFDLRRVGNILLWIFDHEIFSMVILSLRLIQEGQLSVSGERMCTILVNSLEDLACPAKVWVGKLTVLDMTPLG